MEIKVRQTMNRWILWALFACSALLWPGCATPPPARHETPAASRPSARYSLQPGDFLQITFFGEPDYTQQVRVDWNGNIHLPFLAGKARPELRAAGLSTAQLAERINKYSQQNEILLNARAQVVVLEYANQTFVLLGQVNQPGRYAFPRGIEPRLDLEDAIALGGGYTRLARQSLVIVKRGDHV